MLFSFLLFWINNSFWNCWAFSLDYIIIDSCPKHAAFSNYQLDSIFPIFFLIFLFLYFSIYFRTKNLSIITLLPSKISIICVIPQCYYCHYLAFERFPSNLGSVGRFLELGIILCSPLSIGFVIFRGSISNLLIKSSRISLYLLGIAKISVFSSNPLTAYLKTRFLRITTI